MLGMSKAKIERSYARLAYVDSAYAIYAGVRIA